MQPSNDTVILDPEPVNSIKINQSKINFDDILSQSDDIVQKSQKRPKNSQKSRKQSTNASKILKQQQKQLEMIESELEEPERQKTIYVIQKYQSNQIFGDFVRNDLKISYSADALNKKSLAQLDAILNKIRVHLDNKNADKLFDNLLVGSTTMMETMSKPFCNVDGFSNMLLHNDSFKLCWERVKCESVMPTIPPHLQMMLVVGQTFYMAYLVNKYKEPSEDPDVQNLIDEAIKEADSENQAQKTENEPQKQNEEEIIQKPILESGMNI